MNFLYVILLLVGVPLIGMILGNILLDNWDNIIKSMKGIGSCFGTILAVLVGLAITGIIGNLLFKAVGEGGLLLSVIIFLGFVALIFSGMKK